MINRYTELVKASNRVREYNDCAVKAVAVVANVSYDVAHNTLKKLGRKSRKGTPRYMTIRAIESLGFKVTILNHEHAMNNAKTLRTLESFVPSRGMFIVSVNRHIIGIRGGMIHDWTEGRCNRILEIFRVSKV